MRNELNRTGAPTTRFAFEEAEALRLLICCFNVKPFSTPGQQRQTVSYNANINARER